MHLRTTAWVGLCSYSEAGVRQQKGKDVAPHAKHLKHYNMTRKESQIASPLESIKKRILVLAAMLAQAHETLASTFQ